MQNVLIIGATSAIAEATAQIYASRGDNLFLLARNQDRLESISADLTVRGASSVQLGALDVSDHAAIVDSLTKVSEHFDRLDVVLIAHGTLPDQMKCQENLEALSYELNVNAISTIIMLTQLANQMEVQGQGTIAVIGSVAGDRGRQSNYIYGAAKGMVDIFLQGLRNRLNKSGLKVLTIKPGFVDTPMTAEFKKGFLWAKPDTIAKGITKAIEKERNVIYLPWFWQGIMLIIRSIPEFIFKKLSL